MTRFHCRVTSLILAVAAAVTAHASSANSRRFYSDDPKQRETESQDASGAAPWEIDLFIDLTINLFGRPGDKTPDVRALNINTIDEVPDSNWFTNRIGSRPITVDQAANGVFENPAPAPGRWMVVGQKRTGFAPGFTMRDSAGTLWFVSLDAKSAPGAATAAILVANKIFWTLGYWQVENRLITVDRSQLEIAPDTTFRPPSGRVRPMKSSDLDDVFDRAAQSADGTYRAVAGRGLPGKILGGFRYHGTRPDDPNDIVPHEHRRELRALKVFGAWTNLTDMKAGNTVDTLITVNGKSVVRHYLQDVGSTFGTGANGPHDYDEGWEYMVDLGLVKKRFFQLGFPAPVWATVPYQENEMIGPFEGAAFDPLGWRPRVATAAFLRARADDNFWAARRVVAFSEEMIRAMVKTGNFSNAGDEQLLGDVLVQRRDRIAFTYLNAINPLVDFTLSPAGGLTFRNAAVDAGVAKPPSGGYRSVWASFDNVSGATSAIGGPIASSSTDAQGPAGLPTAPGAFVKISIAAVNPTEPSWEKPIDVFFRRLPSGWEIVGLDRLPVTN